MEEFYVLKLTILMNRGLYMCIYIYRISDTTRDRQNRKTELMSKKSIFESFFPPPPKLDAKSPPMLPTLH